MSREQCLHSQPWTLRPHFSHVVSARDAGLPAVLIEVPAITPRTRSARRPSRAATERLRIWSIEEPPRRRRRRLRRGVRTAGLVLLTTLSLTTAGVLLRGERGVKPWGVERAPRRPSISLSIEPAALAKPEAPVVLPGYLLPADASEESIHAGS